MTGKDTPRIGRLCVSVVMALTVILVAGDLTGAGAAEEKPKDPKYKYIGVAGCKMCHQTKKQGEQYKTWKKNEHAHAYEVLKSDEANKIAKEKGLKKPAAESPECLRCHATGWNLTAEQKATFLKPKFKIEHGVQCETCHGPGEKYKKLSVMKDHDKSIANGMVLGDEKLCRTCHNAESPTWQPEKYTTKDGKKVGFDYKIQWGMIKHPVPPKPPKPE